MLFRSVIISMGHFYCMLLALFILIMVYRELLNLQRDYEKEKQIPHLFFRIMTWYYLIVAIFYLFTNYFEDKLLALNLESPIFLFLIHYHCLISYAFYAGGIVMFVLSLEPEHYKYQYSIFGWIHLALLLTIQTSVLFAANVYNGLIWYAFPGFLIITNDAFAYLFGIFFGRTPLISISPKKTWEGFIGGFFSTVIVALIVYYDII